MLDSVASIVFVVAMVFVAAIVAIVTIETIDTIAGIFHLKLLFDKYSESLKIVATGSSTFYITQNSLIL